MKFQVITVSGEVVATTQSRTRAIQIAKRHSLSEDRVFELRARDGWITLSIGIAFIAIWAITLGIQFNPDTLKTEWPAILSDPFISMFIIFILPIVGLVTAFKGYKEIRAFKSIEVQS
jgi:hypothetical protein